MTVSTCSFAISPSISARYVYSSLNKENGIRAGPPSRSVVKISQTVFIASVRFWKKNSWRCNLISWSVVEQLVVFMTLNKHVWYCMMMILFVLVFEPTTLWRQFPTGHQSKCIPLFTTLWCLSFVIRMKYCWSRHILRLFHYPSVFLLECSALLCYASVLVEKAKCRALYATDPMKLLSSSSACASYS